MFVLLSRISEHLALKGIFLLLAKKNRNKKNWCRGRALIPRPPDVPSNLALIFIDLIMSQAPILANEHAWTSETRLGYLDSYT